MHSLRNETIGTQRICTTGCTVLYNIYIILSDYVAYGASRHPLLFQVRETSNQSTSQPVNQSTCQPVNLSTSQPVNLSTNDDLVSTRVSGVTLYINIYIYIYIYISKPNVLTLHTTHTHHTHPPPPPPAQPACQRGGGVVSYRAFRKKMGGLVRDPGRAFYLDICRMKWPSFLPLKPYQNQ